MAVQCKCVSYNMKCSEEHEGWKILFDVARLVHAKNSSGLVSFYFFDVIVFLHLKYPQSGYLYRYKIT